MKEKVLVKYFKNDSKFNKSAFKNEESQFDEVSKNGLSQFNQPHQPKFQITQVNDILSAINQLSMKILTFMNSFINFIKEHKKLTFWTGIGVLVVIMTLVGTYYYAATLFLIFVLGGVFLIIFGALILKNLKIVGIGGVFFVYGLIIMVLKIGMNALI